MSEIYKKLQNIQKAENKEHNNLDDSIFIEMGRIVSKKPYSDRNSYYPPKLLGQIIPGCYTNIPFNTNKISNYADWTLFYIFYAFPCEEIQVSAFETLLKRGYVYSKLLMSFIKPDKVITMDNKKHSVILFDPFTWEKVNKEVIYDEKFVATLERL